MILSKYTISEAARKAGVSRSTIYRHLANIENKKKGQP